MKNSSEHWSNTFRIPLSDIWLMINSVPSPLATYFRLWDSPGSPSPTTEDLLGAVKLVLSRFLTWATPSYRSMISKLYFIHGLNNKIVSSFSGTRIRSVTGWLYKPCLIGYVVSKSSEDYESVLSLGQFGHFRALAVKEVWLNNASTLSKCEWSNKSS